MKIGLITCKLDESYLLLKNSVPDTKKITAHVTTHRYNTTFFCLCPEHKLANDLHKNPADFELEATIFTDTISITNIRHVALVQTNNSCYLESTWCWCRFIKKPRGCWGRKISSATSFGAFMKPWTEISLACTFHLRVKYISIIGLHGPWQLKSLYETHQKHRIYM